MADRTTEFLLRVIKVINPVVAGLLKSPVHGLMSKDILLLHFQGRKSGKWFTTPVSYVQDGNRLRVFTESPWWKNLRDRPEAHVHLRGKEQLVRASTRADGGEYVHDAIRDFLQRVPRDARYYSVRLDRDGRPNEEDIVAAAGRTVLLELELADHCRASSDRSP